MDLRVEVAAKLSEAGEAGRIMSPEGAASRPKKRLQYIDSMRGIAALSVLMQHVFEHAITANPSRYAPLHMVFIDSFAGGRFGIALFFLISGFVIPHSMKPDAPIRSFLTSRFFRLYPAYWLSIGVALCAYKLLGYPDNNFVTIVANLSMFALVLNQPLILGIYWTLTLELFFYATCITLFIFGVLRSWKVMFAVTIVMIGIFWCISLYGILTNSYHSQNIALNTAYFFIGALFRMTKEQSSPLQKIMRFFIPALLITVILSFSLMPNRNDPLFTSLSYCSAYTAALILFFVRIRSENAGPSILIWLGGISYSLYLFHEIVVRILERLLPVGDGAFYVMLFLFLSLAVSITLAWVVYRTVELPSIMLGRRLDGDRPSVT